MTVPPPGPPLSSLISTREASHDALEMMKDLKINPLALRGLSSVELEESLIAPAPEWVSSVGGLTAIKQALAMGHLQAHARR